MPKSNGFLIIEANGGLNQQRLSVCFGSSIKFVLLILSVVRKLQHVLICMLPKLCIRECSCIWFDLLQCGSRHSLEYDQDAWDGVLDNNILNIVLDGHFGAYFWNFEI